MILLKNALHGHFFSISDLLTYIPTISVLELEIHDLHYRMLYSYFRRLQILLFLRHIDRLNFHLYLCLLDLCDVL